LTPLCFSYDKALEAIEIAIKHRPRFTVQIHNQAVYHAKLQDWPNAIKSMENLLSIDPNDNKALQRLAEFKTNQVSFECKLLIGHFV
jgi:hypothetical protein